MFIVRLDLPGISADDVAVDVSEDAVVISGKRCTESCPSGDSWQADERRLGRFFRRLLLPDGAASAQTRPTLADGVLEVTVPVIPYRS